MDEELEFVYMGRNTKDVFKYGEYHGKETCSFLMEVKFIPEISKELTAIMSKKYIGMAN